MLSATIFIRLITSFNLSRDDDDINDVASMAGVNLSEESARILATNSELIGAVTRSCKEETFLSTSSLSRRVLEIGEREGARSARPDCATLSKALSSALQLSQARSLMSANWVQM